MVEEANHQFHSVRVIQGNILSLLSVAYTGQLDDAMLAFLFSARLAAFAVAPRMGDMRMSARHAYLESTRLTRRLEPRRLRAQNVLVNIECACSALDD